MQIYPSDTRRGLFMEFISGKPLPRSPFQLSNCPAVQQSSCYLESTLRVVPHPRVVCGVLAFKPESDRRGSVSISLHTPTPKLPQSGGLTD